MDFGLGLVLSFTDNATAGINSAVNSLNQLTHQEKFLKLYRLTQSKVGYHLLGFQIN